MRSSTIEKKNNNNNSTTKKPRIALFIRLFVSHGGGCRVGFARTSSTVNFLSSSSVFFFAAASSWTSSRSSHMSDIVPPPNLPSGHTLGGALLPPAKRAQTPPCPRLCFFSLSSDESGLKRHLQRRHHASSSPVSADPLHFKNKRQRALSHVRSRRSPVGNVDHERTSRDVVTLPPEAVAS